MLYVMCSPFLSTDDLPEKAAAPRAVSAVTVRLVRLPRAQRGSLSQIPFGYVLIPSRVPLLLGSSSCLLLFSSSFLPIQIAIFITFIALSPSIFPYSSSILPHVFLSPINPPDGPAVELRSAPLCGGGRFHSPPGPSQCISPTSQG